MKRRVHLFRRLIRGVFGSSLLPVRGEAGTALWFSPAEHPSLMLGTRRVESDIARDWAALLRPDDVIFDIGANIGFTVQRFHGLLRGLCRIWAFEPLPRNVAILKRNVRKLPGVVVVESAVGNHDGRATLEDNRHYGSLSRLSEVGALRPALVPFWDDVQQIDVPIVTLDTFVASPGATLPAFMKIDVEGAGHHVLRGATHVLQSAKPVVSCSYHSDDERHGVVTILTQHGYRAVVREGAVLKWVSPDSPAGHFVHPQDARAGVIR